jgi:hypothetical protein
MRLKSSVHQQLYAAILVGLNADELLQAVELYTEAGRYDWIVAADSNFRRAAEQVIADFERSDQIPQLVHALRQINSSSEGLRRFEEQYVQTDPNGGSPRLAPEAIASKYNFSLPTPSAHAVRALALAAGLFLGMNGLSLLGSRAPQPSVPKDGPGRLAPSKEPGRLRVNNVFVHPEGGRRYLIDFRVDNQGGSDVAVSRLTLEHVDEGRPVDFQGYSHIYASEIDIAQTTYGKAEQILSQVIKPGETDRFGVRVRVGRKGFFHVLPRLHTNFGTVAGRVIKFQAGADPDDPVVRALSSPRAWVRHYPGLAKVVTDGTGCFVIIERAEPGAKPKAKPLAYLSALKGMTKLTVLETGHTAAAFTDEWLRAVDSWGGLQFLWLEGTDVTGAGLAGLKPLDGPNPYVRGYEARYGPNGYVTLEFDGPTSPSPSTSRMARWYFGRSSPEG